MVEISEPSSSNEFIWSKSIYVILYIIFTESTHIVDLLRLFYNNSWATNAWHSMENDLVSINEKRRYKHLDVTQFCCFDSF